MVEEEVCLEFQRGDVVMVTKTDPNIGYYKRGARGVVINHSVQGQFFVVAFYDGSFEEQGTNAWYVHKDSLKKISVGKRELNKIKKKVVYYEF